MIQNVDRTTGEGLCTSCGICAAVCPADCIRYERQKETYLPVIDYDKCIHCGKCLRVCPGYSYIYEEGVETEPVCFSVQARDEELLKNASSGGLITAMVKKLLQDEKYQKAFLALDYNYEKQAKTEPVKKGDDLRTSQQSRYLPVSQEKAIKYILENPEEKIIFVGTGCAVHGLCRALKAAGRSRENVLIFGLFCDQSMTYSIYEYMKKLKNWKSPVAALHFRDKRAGGWPGNLRIEFEDGTHENLSAKERMLVKDFCRQKRCLYCLDKLNAEADLSVGDNYTKKDDSKEGSNSLLLRTLQGKQAWEYCREEFQVFPADYQDIRQSQHLDKKWENQWINNLIFAKEHEGRKVEEGLPYDLRSCTVKNREVTKRDRKGLENKLRELTLGEKKAYALIRRKRAGKLGKMYWAGIAARLHPGKRS